MLNIRKAELNDANEIAKIKVDTWRSAYKGIIPDDYLSRLDYDEQARRFGTLIAKEKDTFVLVAEKDSQIIAFAAGGKERTSEYHYDGELYSIYVRDEYQKKGVGKELMSQAAKKLSDMGLGSMMVWVLEESPYRKFYEKLKGDIVERTPFHLVDSNLYLIGYGWNVPEF